MPRGTAVSARLVLVVGLLVRAGAAEPGAVEWLAGTARARVGDPVPLTLRYRWRHDAAVLAAVEPAELMADEILESLRPERRYRDGHHQVREWTMVAVAPRSGSWVLPAPSLRLRAADGTEVTCRAETLAVAVELAAMPEHLPPASPLYLVPPTAAAPAWPWWVGAGSGCLALGVVVLLLRLRRRRAPAPTPLQRFRRDLELLERLPDGKAAAAALSVAARAYCGRRFEFDGAGSTTRELDRSLAGRIPDDHRLAGRRLLDRLDGLRWAPGRLERAAVEPLRERVRAWVAMIDGWIEEERARAAAVAAGGEAAAA